MTETGSLDPQDWDKFSRQAHAALDAAIAHMKSRAEQPVWQAPPDHVRDRLHAALPTAPEDADNLIAQMSREFLPYGVGNTHARFFGWVHGAGTPDGVIPEMMAAAMNANLGGRDHIANEVEKQVIDWCRQIFAFPEGAGGLVVSGTSMATVIALKAAREKIGGTNLRKSGLRQGARLVGYASREAHSCVARAFDILGLGSDSLRPIASDDGFRMDCAALTQAIEQDLAEGATPFCVVGTAGAVNTGAIDPLADVARIAKAHGMWFHVDGAFGALGMLDAALRPRLDGIEQADSIAFDFHKWMHVNYDAGFVLVRDAEDQRRAFSVRPDYLEGTERGLAAGNPWFCEYGPELSRGFRALKIWYHMKRFGLDRLGERIAENCRLASLLADLVRTEDQLQLLSSTGLNITCFRFDPGNLGADALDRLNSEIVIRLQESGIAAPSTTRINGKLAIRVNITNHRTTSADIELLVAETCRIGADCAGG